MSETPRTHGLHRQLMTVENIGPVESYKRMSILAETLEAELAAAEAELAAMRSGEVVAWATPDLWRVLSEAHRKREVEVGSTVFVGQFTIPLYRSPALAAEAEALPEWCPEKKGGE